MVEKKYSMIPWAKTPREGSESNATCHLLIFHGLDAAAACVWYLRLNPDITIRLERITGVHRKFWIPFLSWLMSIHDIGKASEAFQWLNPELAQARWGRPNPEIRVPSYSGTHHTHLGHVLWVQWLRENLISHIDSNSIFEEFLPQLIQEVDADEYSRSMLYDFKLVVPFFGHHGKPSNTINLSVDERYTEISKQVALDISLECSHIIGSQLEEGLCRDIYPKSLDILSKYPQLSFIFAGIAIVSDWLASNTEYFEICDDDTMSAAEYFRTVAMPKAEQAVRKSGLVSATPLTNHTPLRRMMKFDTLTPLQEWADSISVQNEPHLFIVEDVAGAGKTEAVIALIHRLMAAGDIATGFYFALPTRATANGLYLRLESLYKYLYESQGERADLSLSHGGAATYEEYLSSVIGAANTPMYNGAEEAYLNTNANQDVASNAAWINQSSKKSFLADVSIGTIDQGLLASMPTNHQSLRLLGLSRKILVVDEVHAYDTYMNALLGNLVEIHSSLGGSTILLSATLPMQTRKNLIGHFQKGLGYCNYKLPEAHQIINTIDYPLAICLSPSVAHAEHRPTRPELVRSTPVRFIHQAEDVISYLIEKAQSGGCAFWIRNTVRDAVEAYELLREKAPHIRVILFHARFIGYDRNAIEKKVLETFGKTSTSEIRRQTILIATQVVEQSLDLDCDWMVSDIAPIDLLIQRLGRMRRHSRDKDGNRINGADQRSGAELVVFAPEWTDNPDSQWLSAAFQGSKAVYTSLPLYRTMAELRKKMVIRIPTDSRELIENVFGDKKITPVGLEREENRNEGQNLASRISAYAAKLTVQSGYSATSLWDERESIGTREGAATTTIRLLVYDNNKYIPFAEYNALKDGKNISKLTRWELSEVRIRSSFIQQDSLPESFDEKILLSIKENMPDKGKSCYIVVLQEEENCEGVIVGTDGVARRVTYSPSVGLITK